MSDAAKQALSRVDATAALAHLVELSAGEVVAVMLITRQNDSLLDYSQLRPTRRALPVLNDLSRETAASYAQSEVIDYGPSALAAAEQVMWIGLDAVPMLQTIADGVSDLANMPVYDPGRVRLGQLRLSAMRVQAGSRRAVLVQSLGPSQVIAQSRARLGVVIRRGFIDTPPQGNLLLFSRDVAAVIVGEIVIFRDRPGFQRLFGVLEEIQQQAAATFAAVTKDLRIRGLEEMSQVVLKSPAMLGKMASIQRKLNRYPQYKSAYTMPKLIKFVKGHPQCEVAIVGEGDDAQFVFTNDAQHRFKILKLLDDDYLRSELTTLDYDANSKSDPLVGTT